MRSFDRGNQALAVGLAMLAGFVDATGFIATGGFFLSFMSGNSTRLGIGIIGSAAHWMVAASLIGAFVCGVMAGTLLGRAAGVWHRPTVLLGLGLLLVVAATLASVGMTWPALLLTAAAMGAENTVFEADGEVRIGLTYMTGNLVKFGQRLAGVLIGRGRWEWVPFLALWSAMVAGAVLGAAVWPVLGLGGLWVAATVAMGLAGVSWRLERGS
nr:YoaK family protein [Polymorphobacter sp.]